MKCSLVSCQKRGTINVIFNLRQLQEKHLTKNRRLYLAFINLEKAFNLVSHAVFWWDVREFGGDESLVKTIQLMNQRISSRVRVGGTYSNPFSVKVT